MDLRGDAGDDVGSPGSVAQTRRRDAERRERIPEVVRDAARERVEVAVRGLDTPEVRVEPDLPPASLDEIKKVLASVIGIPTAERLFHVGDALRLGLGLEEVHRLTRIEARESSDSRRSRASRASAVAPVRTAVTVAPTSARKRAMSGSAC
jgi:hypothetical protein